MPPELRIRVSFGESLENGIHSIHDYPESRAADAADYLQSIRSEMNESQFIKGGYLDQIDQFDYSFFGLTPKTAQFMKIPNQRMFLQTAWHTIEDTQDMQANRSMGEMWACTWGIPKLDMTMSGL